LAVRVNKKSQLLTGIVYKKWRNIWFLWYSSQIKGWRGLAGAGETY